MASDTPAIDKITLKMGDFQPVHSSSLKPAKTKASMMAII